MGRTLLNFFKDFPQESLSQLYFHVDKCVNLLCTKICAINPERKWYKNLSIILARLVPDCILGSVQLIIKIDKLSKKYDYDKCEYVANLVGNWHEKEIMKKEWFGSPVLHKFEDIMIYCPENCDLYLSHLYNDYMKLPPKEKQVSHHDYIELNLDNPYLFE